MRRRNGGAGVAPAPCGNAHRRSGSPWVPVRTYYEGCLQWLDASGTKRRKPHGHAGLDPRPDPEARSRVEDATVERRSGVPRKGHAGTFTEVPD